MKKGLWFLFLLVILWGCRKEPISWEIDTLFPILHTRITLQQAAPSDMLGVINGNELQLEYQGNLIKLAIDSSLSFPDTSIADTFNLPFGNITFQPGQTFLEDSNYTRYDFGNAKLTQLNILSGQMTIRISSELQGPSVLEYSLPTITKNGIALFIKENVAASTGGNPTILSKVIDLSGYEISLTGLQNNAYNIIASKYQAYIDSASIPVPISSGQRFIATNSLSNIEPAYLRGSFGNATSRIKENKQETDLFNNLAGGNLSLAQSTLVFEIKNDIGADITVNTNSITGQNTRNNTATGLTGPLSNGPINSNRATELNGIFSSPIASTYSVELNNQNSNVTEFISNLPDQLSYDFDISFNPLGNVSGSNDFLYGNTGMEINLDAKIPLNFNANNLIFIDTTDFDIDTSTQEQSSRIMAGFLNIYTRNWFPFDLELQFYLLDANLNKIDSVFETAQTVYGGNPIFGIVDDPTLSKLQAPLSTLKIQHLYQTKSIQTRIKVNSTDTGNIRILESYFIDTKIVGDFNYQVEIE
ncbi:MAG: hypothetical protein ACI85Q_000055 [Salibacteraceae bacterium]|jgi:hypothetical protein